jgi:hypothetical protein
VRPPADPVGAIQVAFTLARREYIWFLLLWIPAFLLELAAGFADPLYRQARGLPAGTLTTGETLETLGVQVPLLFLAYTVRFALWAFIALRTLDAVLGGERTTRWRTLVIPSLALGGILVLTYTAGALLVFVGFFVFLHWFLYAPAMLANGAKGVGAALEASRAFARERRTFGFTALVVLLGMIAFVASYLLEKQAGPGGIILPGLFAWLVAPIVPMLAASFVAISQKEPPVVLTGATPEPRAATTCPRCATLIPYASAEEAVEVVCPSCGYAGSVL